MTDDNTDQITVMTHGPHADGGPETAGHIIQRLELDEKRVLVELLCTYCGGTAYVMTKKAWIK